MQFEQMSYTRAATRLRFNDIPMDGGIVISNPRSPRDFWLTIFYPMDENDEIKATKIVFASKKEMAACLSGFSNF